MDVPVEVTADDGPGSGVSITCASTAASAQ